MTGLIVDYENLGTRSRFLVSHPSMRRSVSGMFAILLCIPATGGKKDPVLRRYQLDEAYRVYETILPNEESYSFAKGTLVLQLETGPLNNSPYGCLSDEASRKFRDATTDFATANAKSWTLQPKFKLEKPYQLVSSEAIHRADFQKQYPSSGGFITLSAVGFNKPKTLAIVYSESSCGGLCGSFRFHLLERVQGKWKEVNGVTCAGFS